MSALPVLSQKIPACSSSMRNCSLLTLTLGHQTGWALQKRDGDITHGSMAFRPTDFEGEGMAFLRFRYWIEEMSKKSSSFDAVIFADTQIHSSTQLAVAYGGFLAHLTAWAEWRQVPYIGASMADVRKLVIGHDETGQQNLIDALRRRGYITVTKETVGALALLEWALHYKSRGNA
jgi:hypothetical protein